MSVDQSRIRNFCIIAHIDHGKSTLADRIIEKTGLLTSREMQNQVLDNMDLNVKEALQLKLRQSALSIRQRTARNIFLILLIHRDMWILTMRYPEPGGLRWRYPCG